MWTPYLMCKEKKLDDIIYNYLLLVEKISNTVRQSKNFDTDVDIYRSEIHIIKLIGDSGELHVSQIAQMIGITKGTASQIIKRLEQKGLIIKRIDENNNTRLKIRLTGKGEIAYEAHEQFHHCQHQHMKGFLASLEEEQSKAVEDFLVHAKKMIEGHT